MKKTIYRLTFQPTYEECKESAFTVEASSPEECARIMLNMFYRTFGGDASRELWAGLAEIVAGEERYEHREFSGPEDNFNLILRTFGDFGTLVDYRTGKDIAPATQQHLIASQAAGPEGVILIDENNDVLREDDRGAEDARRCYVRE